jgi:acylglycerol lipase
LGARHPDLPFFLLGESMGASVAIVASAGDPPPPVDGYVLLTPALYGREAMNAVLRGGLWLVAHTIPVVPFQGGVGGIVASDNPAALRRLGRDPLVIRHTRVDSAVGLVDLMDAAVAAMPGCCRGAFGRPVPTLVLVGARDRVVPQHASRAALEGLPPGRVRLGVYPEGYHLLLADRNREAVAQDVLAFLIDPSTPLPSRAESHVEEWLAGRPLRTGS